MTLTHLHKLLLLVLVVALAGCSGSNDNTRKRARRDSATQPSSSLVTIPPISTETTVSPGASQPLLSSEQIAQSWAKTQLCGLISQDDAQKILKSTAVPDAQYTYSENSGARCSYSNSSGDEIYIEISVNSYARSRAIDMALAYATTPISVPGLAGVSQTNKSTGVTYYLNIWGPDSNQWSIGAPRESQTKEIASTVVDALI